MIDSWININDKLPEVDNRKYLVWTVPTNNNYPPSVKIGKWREEVWYLQGSLLDSHEFTVTHWQRLPVEPLGFRLAERD